MGNKNSYIAKDTFQPSSDVFKDCIQKDDPKGGATADVKSKQLKEQDALSICMDDKLKMITEETGLEGPGGTRLHKMKNLVTKKEGLVLADSVAKLGTVECEKWYFGKINRSKAADYLQFEANVNGSYLIRASEKKESNYCLSLKAWKKEKNEWEYKHYLILQNEKEFWIKGAMDNKHNSLSKLVEACQANVQSGLACRLTEVAIKPRSANLLAEAGGQWDIPRTELTKDVELGRGNFGIVYKGTWQGKVPVAIKQLRDDRMGEDGAGYERARHEFLKEAKIFQMVNHPNLVQVCAICVDEAPFLLITEFLPNGDLKGYFKKPEAKENLPFDKLILISANIASGMAELHKIGIVHRDLAARNVMLDKWLQAKVGDFGLARQGDEYTVEATDDEGNKKKLELPWKWVAPEAAMSRTFDQPSDVWSFGITLWEIFTFGGMPYPTMTNAETLKEIQEGYRMSRPKCPAETTEEKLNAIYGVMLSCWAQVPGKRPPMDTLQQDLDDFETAAESKYADYADLVPKYQNRKPKSNKPRDEKIKKRPKKKKEK